MCDGGVGEDVRGEGGMSLGLLGLSVGVENPEEVMGDFK